MINFTSEIDQVRGKLELITARKLLGQKTVAKMAGVSGPAVSKWVNAGGFDIENIEKLANSLGMLLSQFLAVSADDLLIHVKRYKESLGNVVFVEEPRGNYSKHQSVVPLVSRVQAGMIEEAILDLDEPKMITTKKSHSPLAYAVQVQGDSMTSASIPTFPEGIIVLADPNQIDNLNNNDFVIAKIDHEDAVTFKQLKFDGDKPYLNPLNPEFPKIFNGFRVIAKVFDVCTDDWI